jgi:hypothetical protein
MPNMVWFYSIPIVVVFVVGVLAGTFRRNLHCSSCVTPVSARRRSLFRLPFGGWVARIAERRWIDRGGVCPGQKERGG